MVNVPSGSAQQGPYANVSSADRGQIVTGLARINLSPSGEWLHDTHKFSKYSEVRKLRENSPLTSDKQEEFTEYLAASSFIHCGDGWGYLGRALDALLRGDVHTAVHLTYYAELRAALALMASEGVYVGDYYTCVIDGPLSNIYVSKESTHKSIWKCLDEWHNSSKSKDLIGQVLRPGGNTLESWIDSISGNLLSPFVSTLFDEMKIDLVFFEKDRKNRNFASYTPTRLHVDDLPTDEIRNIISNVWLCLEPDSQGSFPVLDGFLLRDTLVAHFSATNKLVDSEGNLTEATDWSQWQSWLDGILPAQMISTSLHKELLAVSTQGSKDSILSAAFESSTLTGEPRMYVEGMLLRATVLLRLATGSCIQLLDESGLDDTSIFPWVESLSLSRGIWPVDDLPEDRIDLWADNEIVLEELAKDKSGDLNTFVKNFSYYFPFIGQVERVVAWSFA